MAVALIVIGSVLLVVAAGLIYWPSAVAVAGLLILLAGLDLSRGA